MYLTQSTFLGKTGPIDPARVIPVNPPPAEKFYPNRWQEDRNLRSLHKRLNSTQLMEKKIRNDERPENDKLHVANQKYLAIIYDIVKPDHVWKLLKWVNNLNEQNKKGLRVLKTIVDIRGSKRFKRQANQAAAQTQVMDADALLTGANFSPAQAQEVFRKITNKTSYRTQFGEPPKAAEDYVILKAKKFRSLEISQYIQEIPARFIENWLELNDQDEFTRRIYFTIREMHTIIRNQEAPIASNTGFFRGRAAEKVPRFDKMILNARQIDRAKSQAGARWKRTSIDQHEHLARLLAGKTEMERNFPSMIDTKQFKQDFLRGQPFNITKYVELKDPKVTSYQEAMHGKHHDDKATIVDFERISCGIGGVIPDPNTMTTNQKKIDRFSDHLRTMYSKTFTYTGDSWC